MKVFNHGRRGPARKVVCRGRPGRRRGDRLRVKVCHWARSKGEIFRRECGRYEGWQLSPNPAKARNSQDAFGFAARGPETSSACVDEGGTARSLEPFKDVQLLHGSGIEGKAKPGGIGTPVRLEGQLSGAFVFG